MGTSRLRRPARPTEERRRAAAEARQRLGPARAATAQRRRERAPERPRDPSSAGDIFDTTTSSRRRRLDLGSCPFSRRRRRPCHRARCRRCARRARACGLPSRHSSSRRRRRPVPHPFLGGEIVRRRRMGAARGGVSVAWLLIGSLLLLQPLLPLQSRCHGSPEFQSWMVGSWQTSGIVQTYLRPPVRRTQPDFSSVLPTDKGDLDAYLVALSGTRSEKQRSLRAARSPL